MPTTSDALLGALIPAGMAVMPVDPSFDLPLLAALLFALCAVAALLVNLRITATKLRRIAEGHEYLAQHDPLTGLPNRVLFRDRVEQAMAQARRDGNSIGVLMMDLDRFKEINDTLGHHHGDRLLQDMSARLQTALREVDTIARLGGDEFAVLLPSASHSAAAAGVAEKIRHAVKRPLKLDDFTLSVDVSIGIAMFPDQATSYEELMQRADVAMYNAKTAKTGTEIYAAEQDKYSASHLALVHQMKRAIDGEELLFHYQPKVSMASGRVAGVEALVRWRHPSRGLLWPSDFLSIAESTTYVESLTGYALKTALRQSAMWHEQGFDTPIAVNLSGRNLADRRLAEKIGGELERWDVPSSRLQLEIDETAIMVEPERSIDTLAELRELGVAVIIDHFGTAMSSLSYLRHLPVDGVKIDKSFIRTMHQNKSDMVIVRSVIDLALSLGLSATAEGVENKETWDDLRAFGCIAAQGYWCARPTPADLVPWLAGLVEVGENIGH